MIKTYGKIKFEKESNQWKIWDAQPHVCIKLKAIFEKIPKSNPQPFKFINTDGTAVDLLWFIERYPLQISDADFKKLNADKKSFLKDINELEAILLPDYIPTDVELKYGEKRLYQLTGKDIYMKCKRILIGDDIGLGKTIIAILSMMHKETMPCMVVVQAHLPKQWKAKIEEFTNLKVHLIKGTKPYDIPTADVYITTYHRLSGWVNIFETRVFKSAVFDEVQELRISTSEKYKGASVLSNNVNYCLGLSASPVYNFGDEIYNVINLIKNGALGNRYDFQREWCGGSYNGRAVIDPQALGTYLRDNFLMLRRTRKDVGKELPPVNKIIYEVECDYDEVAKIEDLARQLAIKITTGSFIERGTASREFDMLMRKATGVSKARGVCAYVKLFLENNTPIVLAGWHRDVYDIWLEELADYKPVMYTGTESPKQKQDSIDKFLAGESNVFIISLRSGIGLDGLQARCNTIVLGELDWSPKVHDQLIGRVDREGQREPVTAIYCVSDEGSDPLIIDLLGIKSSQSHGINDPLVAMPDKYTDESRIKQLAEQYLKKKPHA